MLQRLKNKPKNYADFEAGIKTKRNRSNRYDEKKYIGEGGMGLVVLAKDLATNEHVAIKKSIFKDKKSVSLGERDFLEKLNNLSGKDHLGYEEDVSDIDKAQTNYIIEYKEAILVEKFDEDASKALIPLKNRTPCSYELWIVQEFCEFGDLYHIMRTLNRPYKLQEIKHLVANIVLGLKYIHSKNIVHRDIKCLNILLTRAGRVKICDFGRAEKCNFKKEHDVVKSRVTDLWMAPEMFEDNAMYGFEVDIWALGITMLEMYKREPPFANYKGGMIGSNVMNLPSMRPPEQRKVLGIPPPPKKLTESSKGKNNNYYRYYEDDYDYYTNMFASPEKEESEIRSLTIPNKGSEDKHALDNRSQITSTDAERDGSDALDMLNQFSSLRMSIDGYTELKKIGVEEVNGDADVEGLDKGYKTSAAKSEHFVEVDFASGKHDQRTLPSQKGSKARSVKLFGKSTGTDTGEFDDSDSDGTFVELTSLAANRPNIMKRLRNSIKRNSRKKSGESRKKQTKSQKTAGLLGITRTARRESTRSSGGIKPELSVGEREEMQIAEKLMRPRSKTSATRRPAKSKLRARNIFDTGDEEESYDDFNPGSEFVVSIKPGLKMKDKPKQRRQHGSKPSKKRRNRGTAASRKTLSKNKSKKSKEQKQKSLVGDIFGLSTRSKNNRQSARKEKEREIRKQQKLEWKKRHSYIQLQKFSDEVMFYEFVAWCLSTDQKQRPTAFELTEHPFIKREVKSLIRSERTDCAIREHSDFLLRADDLNSPELRQEDIEEQESDDDIFLDTEELEHERKQCKTTPRNCSDEEICTCSFSQRTLRESLCAELSQKRGIKDIKKSSMYL